MVVMGWIMRILVISDVHANLYALRAVFDLVKSYDYVVYLGDAVDYGPHPDAVVDFLMEHVDVWVRGNHDHAVATGADCKSASMLHKLSVYVREKITNRLLGSSYRRFLGKLPLVKLLDIGGVGILCVHASPRNPLYEYVRPDTPDDILEEIIDSPIEHEPKSLRYILLGHTHIPMVRRIQNIIIVNPGSIGQPRDGDPRASYALIDIDSMKVIMERVEYPVHKVIDDIKSYGLEKKYERLLIEILLRGRAPGF